LSFSLLNKRWSLLHMYWNVNVVNMAPEK